ncbi:signal peptide peptidase-like 2A isoform X3 [Canis lupus baileyi]|uniref:Signal peptide peptidase-like 2A n=2 Tax=Canis lupus TaxID=9612 RepID=A0A8P0SJI2_CANLF|nr:signal peptide peptidase-like 2A isoform X3 [Canis lupus familiaris]XP_025328592.1 signal peptide peptidase-like 2A isoform X6 [Canis lupus dingo]XP_038298250.1 signal peptide peptidase-like 2A isoform X3 [Canis lupus familiaris]XP_038436339.1 signal peptide peptidase-like 2A isoform X3 [Canis lupus familiaris]|eukprot:XP_022268283.1 signal peptide peptidase-like 2A isoform X3 [Canis lupus familiaris]
MWDLIPEVGSRCPEPKADAQPLAIQASLISYFLCIIQVLGKTAAQEAILHASGNGKLLPSKDYCMLYNPQWTSLPNTLENATSVSLMNLTTTPLCNLSDIPPDGIKSKAVVVKWGTCHILEKARIAQTGGAEALLVANNSVLFPPSGNKSEFHDVKILIAFISRKDFIDMKQTLGDNITVKMYSPSWPNFDYTMVVIFVIAVFTVALGGYWSGLIELESMKAVTNTEDRETRRKKDEYLTFSPLTVVIFVVVCCVMMVLLYFFYKWLVYVMIAIFCIASAMSLYNCLAALIRKIPCGQCTFMFRGKSIEVRLILLSGLCIAVAVVWAVFRNEDRWAWILQDILGIAFCLNLIKTLKLPNFKSCVILLGLLLLYDVFFVFITPFITKNGESIMVELAAGPFGNNEKLPVVIRVPKLAYFSVMSVCLMPVSILGFGDIIVPGLLVAYCRRFDVQTGSSSIYYVSSTIAYAVGMILTFVVLVLMKKGQPALLYLVPCTLVTASIVAWRRKEMKKFWKGSGYQVMDHLDYATNEENPVTAGEQIVQQ